MVKNFKVLKYSNIYTTGFKAEASPSPPSSWV